MSSSAANDSRIAGLYKLGVAQRIEKLLSLGWLSKAEAEDLRAGRQLLSVGGADKMVENVIGVFGLPLAIAPNFRVNGVDRLVPLVVEEPSVVAALSGAAALARASGGFRARCDESLLAGQLHIVGLDDIDAATKALTAASDELLAAANAVHPRLVERGGGVREFEYRALRLPDGEALLAMHVLVDSGDAMGANLVNSICEAIAPQVTDVCGATVPLRILSNLADRSLVRADVRYAVQGLATLHMSGEAVRDAIVLANDIAIADPHRAATHNKGILNGIDPLAIATGNDWRAIEAGAHAYAALEGSYRPLTNWSVADDGDLVGEICLPLKPGIVGGTLASNRAAALGLALTGVASSGELAELMAAVGLAQNFAAIRALVTSGIQEGHMRLHARSVASAAGADDASIDMVVEKLVSSGEVKDWKAREIIAELHTNEPLSEASTAAGKIILFGEHAVVYGRSALALPIPGAVRAVATEASGRTNLRVRERELDATYVNNFVGTVLRELGSSDRHFAIDVSCKLPFGKGLGSSAAIAVAVTRAIARCIGKNIDDERVNQIAFECERLTHGTPSGVDNTVSSFGRPVLFRRDGGATSIEDLELAETPPIVVAVAQGTGATNAMVEGVRKRRDLDPARYDGIFDQMDAISRAAVTALEARDYAYLGHLMNVCHGLLNAIGVSTAELEHLVEIARDNGAAGAKLTGAGGGGAIVALCPGTRDQVRSALEVSGYTVLD